MSDLISDTTRDTTSDPILGIDLGTTNSEVTAIVEGRVQVLSSGRSNMLPSVVGLSPAGELLVGEAARNQLVLYPERTVRSIKRKMGGAETVRLGERVFSPPEISALILKELAQWAARSLERPIHKAVITVPAYFSDAQRQATREAAELAGLEAVRILNEPTAASLAYGAGVAQSALVYDLGGGTFDVSIVALEDEVTEVLASHGDNRLGGDDFNDLLAEHLASSFQRTHGIDLRHGHPVAEARLWWAAEETKKRLSAEPEVTVREEALVSRDGVPLHLELEVTREEYEAMIRPLVERTLESVSKAMHDAGKTARDLDTILLVGGSTRTPLVSRLLYERTGIQPREEIQPDLCVALGAGVLASRLAGHNVERVLVDVSPYSFGVSYLGERGGAPYDYCYKPIIRRNSALPLTRTERFYTGVPFQDTVHVRVFEGEDEDALRNILIGDFKVEDLKQMPEPHEVLCRMSLDLDGILHVTAIEKCTGKSKQVTIARALEGKSEAEMAEARMRLEALYRTHREEDELGYEFDPQLADSIEVQGGAEIEVQGGAAPFLLEAHSKADGVLEGRRLLERSRQLIEQMHEEDREEAINLNQQIESAMADGDELALAESTEQLRELLFFVAGRA
ncbi:MAG: molecular chaperone DnaK [Acidobacteriaceae bacterium]|nr:molecular chaperone DnaK [Acidobacteriaceae bacterium]